MNVITSGVTRRAGSPFFPLAFRYSPGIDTY